MNKNKKRVIITITEETYDDLLLICKVLNKKKSQFIETSIKNEIESRKVYIPLG